MIGAVWELQSDGNLVPNVICSIFGSRFALGKLYLIAFLSAFYLRNAQLLSSFFAKKNMKLIGKGNRKDKRFALKRRLISFPQVHIFSLVAGTDEKVIN